MGTTFSRRVVDFRKNKTSQRGRTQAADSSFILMPKRRLGMVLPVFSCQAKVITAGYFSSERRERH